LKPYCSKAFAVGLLISLVDKYVMTWKPLQRFLISNEVKKIPKASAIDFLQSTPEALGAA
jgi:hypothetical protein